MEQMQVGRQGSYSIERLMSLDCYCNTTSWTRVILVCVFTPISALLVAVLLEYLPLRSPSEGWAANWMLWLHLLLTNTILGTGGNSQITVFVTGSSVMVHLNRFHRYFLAIMALLGVYPLFKVLYDFVPVVYRSGVIIVLPIWRFAAKHFIVQATRELEDIVSEAVAFVVDFFSSLFVSVCMSSSGPMYLSALFIAADLGQLLLEFRELRGNANTLLQLLDEQRDDAHVSSKRYQHINNSERTTLLMTILDVINDPGTFHVQSLGSVRLWACMPHPLTAKQGEQLLVLEASGVYCHGLQPSSERMSQSLQQSRFRWSQPRFKQSTSILPTPRYPMAASTQLTSRGKSEQTACTQRSTKLVFQGLQLLLHCEYLALVEYVECVVPIVFVAYKSLLEQLPNVIYYPGGAGSWGLETVVNILVFAALEVVFLHIFLKRQFVFSSMHQLAFVLETQMYSVQVKLFVEILLLMQFQLVHLGLCFTRRSMTYYLKFLLAICYVFSRCRLHSPFRMAP